MSETPGADKPQEGGKPAARETPAATPAAPPPAVATAPGKSGAGSAGGIVAARKPFPWPFLLAVGLPAGVLAWLGWGWKHGDYHFVLRSGWVALCSVLPGLYLMVIAGSVDQFRRRPLLSSLSLLLAGAALSGCWWAVQQIVQTQWLP